MALVFIRSLAAAYERVGQPKAPILASGSRQHLLWTKFTVPRSAERNGINRANQRFSWLRNSGHSRAVVRQALAGFLSQGLSNVFDGPKPACFAIFQFKSKAFAEST